MTPKLRAPFLLLLLLGALLPGLAACTAEPEAPPPLLDTLGLPAALDTAEAARGATLPGTVIGTVVVPTAASDTVAVPAAQLDSLRAQMARMEALLATRPAARPRTDTARALPARATEVAQEARDAVQSYGLKTFFALIVLLLTAYVVRFLVFILERLAERSAERRLFYKRLVPIARILLWLTGVFFVIRFVFQIGANSLLAAAAAIGVAIGFAAQDILKNIFGGLVIVFDQPFQVGDKISVGGTYGEVVGIGLRSTRIVTPDDNLVSVPNAQVVDGQVSNANAGALDCQVVTDLYLPGWVDEAAAKRIAYDAAASSRYVYLDKPIVVIVKDEFKETFVTHLKVKAYVLDTRYEFLLMSDVTERARLAFRQQGLLRPLHGARAYVDLTAMPYQDAAPANGTSDASPPDATAPDAGPSDEPASPHE